MTGKLFPTGKNRDYIKNNDKHNYDISCLDVTRPLIMAKDD